MLCRYGERASASERLVPFFLIVACSQSPKQWFQRDVLLRLRNTGSVLHAEAVDASRSMDNSLPPPNQPWRLRNAERNPTQNHPATRPAMRPRSVYEILPTAGVCQEYRRGFHVLAELTRVQVLSREQSCCQWFQKKRGLTSSRAKGCRSVQKDSMLQ